MKVRMGEHGLYCEADAEYHRQRKSIVKPESFTIKKIIGDRIAYPDEPIWILDGKMSSDGFIQKSLVWHIKGQYGNRMPKLASRITGTNALDICSSYGVSSRELYTKHQSVDVVEIEPWYAKIVQANLYMWGYKDIINVTSTKDFTNLDYTAYDSVRFGIKEIEHLFWQHEEEFVKMDNVCFEFAANQKIVDILLDKGFTQRYHSPCNDIFTKHK